VRVEVVERRRHNVAVKRYAQLRSLASLEPYFAREAFSPKMQRALNELCARRSFDVVQLEGTVLGKLAIPAHVRVVLDEHNIDYEVFRRMCEGERSLPRRTFNRWEYERVRRLEQRCWARVDGCIVTSEREEPVVAATAPRTLTAVVPNGVDLEYFAPAGGNVEPRTVIFNGTLDYRPNVDAAFYLVEEVWPLVRQRCPDARLTLVGRGAQPRDRRRLSRPGVVVRGEVPDVRPYLERAAVVAVPVRMGGGTRLKVVEGLAMGKAMVSTSLGCEGIAVTDRKHLLIADDAEQFASRVVELFEHPTFGEALGRAGRTLMEAQYSWEHAVNRLEELYERVTVDSSSRRPDRVSCVV
jgi:glycosyltransferase involved in cell wall biosynthesis